MIKEFFEQKEIFLTGGSGVVGKAIIEKLLRSCNVRKIYILIRPKGRLTIEQRLEKMKQAMIFRQLRLQKPQELNEKLVCVPGDAALPYLGITPEYQTVMANVAIIFHCAATVRFDESLRDALKLNVGGTLEMLKFAESLKNLEVVMHVSTFFSNPYLKRVEEKVYDAPMDWKFCLSLVDNKDVSDDTLNFLTRKLIVGFPNTYCFTKNLAEALVNDYRHKLPVAIYRPSIVIFALEEPEPGFSPSLMGTMGLFAVTGAGILKAVYIKNIRLDLSPQDMAVKSCCYYTYKSARLYESNQRPAETPVFITSSCTHSDLTFLQYANIMQDFGFWDEAAFEKNFLIPGLYYTDNRLIYLLLVLFLQILPSLFADLIMVLIGRKPALMSAQRKIFSTLEVMKPFCFNAYESNGMTDINEITPKYNKTDFNININEIGKNFYRNVQVCQPVPHCIREHLLQEDPKTLPRSKKILKTKIYFYKTVKLLLAFQAYEKLVEYLGYIYSGITTANNNSICFAVKGFNNEY